MSILSALKKKFNAKGNNIEEAIKTMEVGGGGSTSSDTTFEFGCTEEVDATGSTHNFSNYVVSDKEWEKFTNAINSGTTLKILAHITSSDPMLGVFVHNQVWSDGDYATYNYGGESLYKYRCYSIIELITTSSNKTFDTLKIDIMIGTKNQKSILITREKIEL